MNALKIGLFHGSPAEHEEFLFDTTPEKRFAELAESTSCSVVITGHSHTPYHKFVGGVHFINPGSVGRMFDGNPETSYAILTMDKETVTVDHFRCPYPVEKVVARISKMGLPSMYSRMYSLGKKLN